MFLPVDEIPKKSRFGSLPCRKSQTAEVLEEGVQELYKQLQFCDQLQK